MQSLNVWICPIVQTELCLGHAYNMSISQTEDLDFSITEDLIPTTEAKRPSITSIDFNGLLTPPLLLQDNPTECGGQLWPGGMVLATYLLQTKMTELKGKTVFVLVRSGSSYGVSRTEVTTNAGVIVSN